MNIELTEKNIGYKENCAGCKWLDSPKGDRKTPDGYCSHVVISSQRNMERTTKFGEIISASVRDETTVRCELYEEGDFKTRYST